MEVLAGQTDVTTYFKLRLAADGTAATGLTITDLDLQYVRSGVAPVAKVDATALAATDSAHADSKAIEIDATDQPGLYRVDWPDAAFSAGVREVILTVKHTTIFTEDLRVNLTPVPVDVRQLLGTAWLTPGTAGTPDVNVKLISGDSGAADNAEAFFDGTGYAGTGNVIPTVTTLTNLPSIPANWLTAAGTAADFSTEIRTAINGGDYALSTDANGRIRIVDGTAAGEINTNGGAIVSVETLTTYTGNTPQTGDAFARIGVAGVGLTDLGGFSITAKAQIQTEAEDALVTHRLDELLNADSDIDGAAPPTVGSVFHELLTKTTGSFTYDQTTDSLEALRDNIGTAGAGLTAADDAVITALATAQTDITAILADTDSLDTTKITTARAAVLTDWIDGGRLDLILDARASQASVDTIDDLLDTEVAAILAAVDTEIAAIQTTLSTLLTTAGTESYRADGATGSVFQLLYEINQTLGEASISSVTRTVKKVDGSTTALTHTLNSATTPTAVTRAT